MEDPSPVFALIVVAILIATITFQTGLNPPGAVWQERQLRDTVKPADGYAKRGTAIGNDYHSINFRLFVYFDMMGLLASSLTMIIMLICGFPLKTRLTTWMLVMAMWIALSSMTLAFAFGTFIISVSQKVLRIIPFILFVWLELLALILVIHFTVLAISLRRKLGVPVNGGRAMENAGDVEAGKIEIRA